MSKLKDLTGEKFGRLTVLKKTHGKRKPSGNIETMWECVCECGNHTTASSNNLRKGYVQSCGCLQKENRTKKRRATEIKINGNVASANAYGNIEFFVSKEDADVVLKNTWHISPSGYVINSEGVELHQILINPQNGLVVHHLDENKLNNRRSNLVVLSRADHLKMHTFLNGRYGERRADNG